jgi:hypothetical protein
MRKGGILFPAILGASTVFRAVRVARSGRIRQAGFGLAASAEAGIFGRMADAEKEQPVMLPFADKEGTGWHVVVRYHEGHERRIDGFATEQEAVDWIIANSGEVDK